MDLKFDVKAKGAMGVMYLTRICRDVAELVRDTKYFLDILADGGCCELIGPDGVRFHLEAKEDSGLMSDKVDVHASGDIQVLLKLPQWLWQLNSGQGTVPGWMDKALEFAQITGQVDQILRLWPVPVGRCLQTPGHGRNKQGGFWTPFNGPRRRGFDAPV